MACGKAKREHFVEQARAVSVCPFVRVDAIRIRDLVICPADRTGAFVCIPASCASAALAPARQTSTPFIAMALFG
jgi:hypothetical protein